MQESMIMDLGSDPDDYLSNGHEDEDGSNQKAQKHAVRDRFSLTLNWPVWSLCMLHGHNYCLRLAWPSWYIGCRRLGSP